MFLAPDFQKINVNRMRDYVNKMAAGEAFRPEIHPECDYTGSIALILLLLRAAWPRIAPGEAGSAAPDWHFR